MALSFGLLAAAGIHSKHETWHEYRHPPGLSWLFLLALIVPTTIILLTQPVASPWHAWRGVLYLSCVWLVFRFLQPGRANFISGNAWAYIILLFAHLYVFYAVIQYYDLRFWYGDRLFSVWNIFTERFPGPLAQANFQGLFLTLSIIAAFRKISVEKRQIWLLLSIIPLAGILLTAGRSTFILLALVIILMTMLAERRSYFLKQVVIALCSAGIIFSIISYFPMEGAVLSPIDRIESSGLATRLIIWDMSWQLFLQHPWLGIGLGNMPAHGADGLILTLQAHPNWSETAKQLVSGHIWAHNLILQFSLELGIIGTIAILALYLFNLKKLLCAIQQKRIVSESFTHGAIASAAILLHGMISVAAMQPFFMVLLAIYLAACSQSLEKRP
jgi:O-antigen ligase